MFGHILALTTRYICRKCGAEIMYPDKYRKCPMCGTHLG